jgi:hypothetical protein
MKNRHNLIQLNLDVIGKKIKRIYMYTRNKKKCLKKRKSRRGGGNWFTRPKQETERKIENSCETDCMKNAKILCDNTCKKVAINSLNTTNSMINSTYIEDIMKDNKILKDSNHKLAYENKKINDELQMIKKVYKIT